MLMPIRFLRFSKMDTKFGFANGGDMKSTIFRVGHIGYLSHDDNTTLINTEGYAEALGML